MLSQNCTKWKSGLVKIAISKDCVKLGRVGRDGIKEITEF